MPSPRYAKLRHAIPGRARFHCSWLAEEGAADHLAEHLVALIGMYEVRMTPYTKSILCHFDPALLACETIAATLADAGAARWLSEGEEPAPEPLDRHVGSIARELIGGVREIDGAILRATEGRADLGTIATFAFVSAGIAEVVVTERLPIPPWFNLAWWGFQTFMSLERRPFENGAKAPATPRH